MAGAVPRPGEQACIENREDDPLLNTEFRCIFASFRRNCCPIERNCVLPIDDYRGSGDVKIAEEEKIGRIVEAETLDIPSGERLEEMKLFLWILYEHYSLESRFLYTGA